MATSLEERNRQVDTLAGEASRVPIDDEPQAVVAAPVSVVRVVMRDPTWRCAVMVWPRRTCSLPGVYHGTDDERGRTRSASWNAGHRSPTRTVPRATSRASGVRSPSRTWHSDRLGAILYAPWEGRTDPSPRSPLRFVGQHAGTRPSTRPARAGPQPGR